MSDRGVKYLNVHKCVCYNQKDDLSGIHVELQGDAAHLLNLGCNGAVPYADIPWLIVTLQDILKQRSA